MRMLIKVHIYMYLKNLLELKNINKNIFIFFKFYVNINKSYKSLCFIQRLPEGSNEDLLSMSQTVFDQLTPLSSYFYKLCTCDEERTYCSYKQYTECKTGIKGKEFHCVLHSSSRRKRDLKFLTQIPGNINKNMEEEPVSFYNLS